MIFTRTQNDVDEAIRIRKEKVQKFQALTEDDIKFLEKGTMTLNTLNRIEQKQQELKNLFNDMGYWNTPIENKSWTNTQIFNIDDFKRILKNLDILRDAFFVYDTTPSTPPVSFHFQDINDLEKILYDMDVMISKIKGNYKICGTFICGG